MGTLTMAPSTSLIMEAIPIVEGRLQELQMSKEDKAGVGSATNDASREIGGAMGIAIGGSLLNEFYRDSFVMPESIDASTLAADPLQHRAFPSQQQIDESGNNY